MLPPPPSIGRRGEAPFGFLTPINVASKIELIAKNCFGNSSFVNWKNPYQYFRTRRNPYQYFRTIEEK